MLREVGVGWGQALGGRRAWRARYRSIRGLHRFPRTSTAGRGGRFSAVDFVSSEVVATRHAGAVPSGTGRVAATCRRVLFG